MFSRFREKIASLVSEKRVQLFLLGIGVGFNVNMWTTNFFELFVLNPFRYIWIAEVPAFLIIFSILFRLSGKDLELKEKADIIFLAISLTSVVFAFINLVVYFSSKTAMWFLGSWETGWYDVVIKGIPVAKLFWSLFLASLFNVLERLVKFKERI